MKPDTRTWLVRGALLAAALIAALLAWQKLRPAADDGSFVTGNGRIEAVDYDKSRLQVFVSIFSRETLVDLDFNEVEKI